MKLALLLGAGLFAEALSHRSQVLPRDKQEALGIVWRGNATAFPNSHDLLPEVPMPSDFTWCNKSGVNYCTMTRNQLIPQFCASCWAFAGLAALGDRIKIARKGRGIDINLSVQHLLNCGGVGSCNGGTLDGTYQWLHNISQTGTGVSYETAQPYIACSSDVTEGFCGKVDTTCKPLNVARTCGSFSQEGGPCTGLSRYPNATIVDYGNIGGQRAMMKEIYHRGPIACGIDSRDLTNYESGIIMKHDWWPERGAYHGFINHIVSVVGWGTDPKDGFYWIVRNSYGESWGEMGYFRVGKGKLWLEYGCAWAVPGNFTAEELHNSFHCHEGGDNCQASSSMAA